MRWLESCDRPRWSGRAPSSNAQALQSSVRLRGSAGAVGALAGTGWWDRGRLLAGLRPSQRRLRPAWWEQLIRRLWRLVAARRPAISSGGYGRPSSSSFGGLGLDTPRGGDRAISRRASNQALQDYRSSQAPPAPAPFAATRRPSAGASESAWGSAPLPRRPEPSGWGGGGYAPSYGGSAPRFGAWDAVLAWSLLNSLSRPQSVAYFQDNRSDPRYTQWRAEADRAAANDPAVAKKLAELDALMTQSKAQPATQRTTEPDSEGSGAILVVVLPEARSL